jgi:hypothetical protein
MMTPYKYNSGASLCISELKRRIDETRWNPAVEALDEVHCRVEQNPPSENNVSTVVPSPPHPRIIRKHFQKMLDSMRVERLPTSIGYLPSFLEAAALRVLHPINQKLVDALFQAGSRMNWERGSGVFACLMHEQALKHGDTPEARMVAVEARAFAARKRGTGDRAAHPGVGF